MRGMGKILSTYTADFNEIAAEGHKKRLPEKQIKRLQIEYFKFLISKFFDFVDIPRKSKLDVLTTITNRVKKK